MNRHSPAAPGDTVYTQCTPSLPLAPYVACHWAVPRTEGKAATRIRVLPDGCMDVIFDLTGGLAPFDTPQAATGTPVAFITGATINPEVIALPASPHVAGVRFRPGGAAAFLNIAARDLAGAHVPLGDIMPELARLGADLMDETHTPNTMVGIIDRLLQERLHRARVPDALTAHAVEAIWRGPASLRVESLARSMGIHGKRLERSLRHQTGLTPKQLARTLRFVSAVRHITAAPEYPLADLALALGFADQAHFNRKFKTMAELSPSAWKQERHTVDFLQYTPVSLA
jgi:AraC-like DNA-binding protein